jgi:hypothetical protein
MKPHERNPLMSFFPIFLFTHSRPFFSSHQSSLSLPPSLPPSISEPTKKPLTSFLAYQPSSSLLLLFPLPKCPSVHPFDETLPNPILFQGKLLDFLFYINLSCKFCVQINVFL